MPIESIGIGNDGIVGMFADPHVVDQYRAFLGYPDPEEESNGEVYYQYGMLVYDASIEELNNITRKDGEPRIFLKEEMETWESLTVSTRFPIC